jgi:YVTN family beta-propeller protein
LFVGVVLNFGCTSDPLAVPPDEQNPTLRGVYILNEGLWGQANASLSYFDLDARTMRDGIFQAVNTRRLGDVGNHIVVRNGSAYIVVNNSDKIEIIDAQNHVSIGTIDAGPGKSPRQIAFVSDTLALVTNLYDASVSVVNISSLSVEAHIPVGSNPEGLAVSSGKAYVANSGFGAGNTVSVIDLASLTVTKTITVAENPADVVRAPGGWIYVVCAGSYGDFGNPDDDTPAQLVVIDPLNDVVLDSVMVGGHAFRMAVGSDGMGYVVGEGSVVHIDTQNRTLLGTFAAGVYYGVGVDAASGEVYLSDPRDYVSPGRVMVYSSNGTLRDEFEAGLIPGRFAFNQ